MVKFAFNNPILSSDSHRSFFANGLCQFQLNALLECGASSRYIRYRWRNDYEACSSRNETNFDAKESGVDAFDVDKEDKRSNSDDAIIIKNYDDDNDGK